ncbi:hypothetical protein ACVWWN_003299 [Mycobacterium sp. URHB0021]
MCAMRPVDDFGSAVRSSNAVWVMSSMSSVSVLARSSVPAPGVATGFEGATALTAMPSSYNSAARLFVMGIIPEVFYLDDEVFLHVLSDEVTPDNEQQIKVAVRERPRQAIAIRDE